jgi:transposase
VILSVSLRSRRSYHGRELMEVLYERCAGLDVHKKTVVACLLRGAPGGVTVQQTRTFSTMLPGLTALREWLLSEGCTAVAMEATGVYWKPVYNVLEDHGVELVVANAEHCKAVPGRKTDVNDAQWIASLLRHGLLRPSFIPDRPQRDLRELTRFRTALVRDRARMVTRLHKTLEGANIKLAAVLTDLTGASGTRILRALLRGEEDAVALADLADVRVQRAKRPQLEEALLGRLTGPLHFVVGRQLEQISALDAQIAACDVAVAEALAPHAALLARLDAIPGIGPRTAEVIVAELGTDLGRFASAKQLAAWAGLAPGNKASGGKQRPARTRRGNPWLKTALTEAAWAAGRSQDSYLGSQYRRFAARKGRKRAVVAVAHTLLTIIYHLLTRNTAYQDLGGDYFDQRAREAVTRRLVDRLEALGHTVTLAPRALAEATP